MQTMTSAKRIILLLKRAVLLLVCLNVVTILTSVTIISSGMFIANAAKSTTGKPCTTTGKSATSSLKFDATVFQGQMLNNNKHQTVANIKLTITNDPTTHQLSTVDFVSTPVFPPNTNDGTFKGGGIPLKLASGTLDGNAQQNALTNFIIDSKDLDDGQPVTIDFSGIPTAQGLGGNYQIKEAGTAPTSASDRGSLTDVQFTATAVSGNAFNFQNLTGSLDTSTVAALSDFTVTNTDTGDVIHFTGGFFINSSTITGNFAIETGPHAGANGAYKVS